MRTNLRWEGRLSTDRFSVREVLGHGTEKNLAREIFNRQKNLAMNFIEILLLSLSLSVDTLVVSMSGSVSLGRMSPSKVLKVSLAFGIMQAGLIFAGWLLGASVASFVHQAAHIIGFVILLYIGGSMIWSAVRKSDENVCLNGMRHLLLAAFATSVDAFAVGVSLAMTGMEFSPAISLTVAVFAMTVLAAVFGVVCGSLVGCRFGTPARVAGGLVLIAIGIRLLI